MIDTSLVERKIHDQVMDMCFEAIVSEAFISGLPIEQSELDDGLTQKFAQYATECLKDLGSSQLLKEAVESTQSVAKKAYLRKMYDVCNEAATTVTARILKEHEGDDKGLKDAITQVTLTPDEYARFSKAAANLTPTTLTDMIQKKTLDVIKDEKDAYKKDAELEAELVNALNAADDDESFEEISTEAPNNESGEPKEGAEIGQESFTVAPATEGFKDLFAKLTSRKIKTSDKAIRYTTPESFAKEAKKMSLPQKDTEVMDYICGGFSSIIKKDSSILKFMTAGTFEPNAISVFLWSRKADDGQIEIMADPKGYFALYFYTLMNRARKFTKYMNVVGYRIECDVASGDVDLFTLRDSLVRGKDVEAMNNAIQGFVNTVNTEIDAINAANGAPAATESITVPGFYMNALESHFVDVQNAHKVMNDKTGIDIGRHSGECCKAPKDPKKAQEAFESYMKTLAGDNYRSKHSSVFSRIQELAYEGIRATTESYSDIPFETMALITKQNTFSRFNSHSGKSVAQCMESISRYAFESTATPDGPEPNTDQLSTALLTASIIYAFFETLNSMNLYCPKLDEIKRFVDETLPLKERNAADVKTFGDLFKGVIQQMTSSVNKAATVPEVDIVQGNLDMVREKINAPGFESIKTGLESQLKDLQSRINTKRDNLVEKQRPVSTAVESYTQTMRRTRDTLKFTRVANTMGRKPNVNCIKCKVDPQKGSKYVAVECFTADNKLAGSTTVVLESNIGSANLVDYVTAAINGSSLIDLDKKVMISDARSGKVYMDTSTK